MQDTVRWLAETGDVVNHYLEAIQSHIQWMAYVNTELRGDLARERARAAVLDGNLREMIARADKHFDDGRLYQAQRCADGVCAGCTEDIGTLRAALAADAPGDAGQSENDRRNNTVEEERFDR